MNGMKTLRAGFTTVRNLGDDKGVTLALRDAIKRGWVAGPADHRRRRSRSRPPAATWTAAARSTTSWSRICRDPENLCDSVESCRRVVRRQIDRGADVIKFATTGGVNSGTAASATRMFEDEARALVDTAHAYGRKVAVHAHGADGIKLALRAGADSIEHGTVMDDEIIAPVQAERRLLRADPVDRERLSRAAAPRIPTPIRPRSGKQIDWRIGITGQSLAKAYPAGVKIAFGTDAGVSKHGRNADEFELMVKYGMPPVEAIEGRDRQRRRPARPVGRGRDDRARQERRHHRGDRRSADATSPCSRRSTSSWRAAR